MAKEAATGVICHKCKTPIPLERTEKIADEISVACPRCGQRSIYKYKEIKSLRE